MDNIKIKALQQEMQNKQFRNAKAIYYTDMNISVSTLSQSDVVDSHGSYKQLLREIYHSPSYKIIRGIKKLNWKLRKRTKKGYYYPATEILCQQECIKILTSPSWNALGIIHFIYQLIRRYK